MFKWCRFETEKEESHSCNSCHTYLDFSWTRGPISLNFRRMIAINWYFRKPYSPIYKLSTQFWRKKTKTRKTLVNTIREQIISMFNHFILFLSTAFQKRKTYYLYQMRKPLFDWFEYIKLPNWYRFHRLHYKT